MKNSIRYHIAAGLTLATCWLQAAADKKPPAPLDKNELRVLAATAGGERRMMVGRATEKEIVAFLGVETSPVSTTVAVQLGLAKGAGLVVNHVVPDSPASGALQENDILLRLDDQILIETRQLAVLIRSHKEGEEVGLTYLRAAKQATARVKLAQKEVPKVTTFFEPKLLPGGWTGGNMMGPGGAGGRIPGPASAAGIQEHREEMDRVLSLMQPGPGHEPVRIQIERKGGPGYRATSINTANSNLNYSDDEGSLELSVKEGQKTLVARNAKGEQLYSGPVTTPAERKAVPDAVRGRLEKLEGMHDMTFHTDGNFLGAEARVLQPAPRGIALPSRDELPSALSRPATFF